MLDADIAGCVSTFLEMGGRLDLWRAAILGLCYRVAALVARTVSEPARTYYGRLERLARLTLETLARDNASQS
jgi:hypothetical protein